MTHDPAARHRARPRLPVYYWVVFTITLWVLGICATLLSALTWGYRFGPLMASALILYLGGIATFIVAWRRIP